MRLFIIADAMAFQIFVVSGSNSRVTRNKLTMSAATQSAER